MTSPLRALLIALTLIVGLAGAAPALSAPTFPALSGRVVDDAHVLSAQTQSDLTAKLGTAGYTTKKLNATKAAQNIKPTSMIRRWVCLSAL